MKEVASLRYGVIFKKAFSDVDVFNGFVRDILGIPFNCDVVETEKEFKPTLGHVKVKFDLYAEDVKTALLLKFNTSETPTIMIVFCITTVSRSWSKLKSQRNIDPKRRFTPLWF